MKFTQTLIKMTLSLTNLLSSNFKDAITVLHSNLKQVDSGGYK